MIASTIKATNWAEDIELLRHIRTTVFIQEQSVPEELEWSAEDDDAYHWLAFDENNQAIGTIRMLKNGHIGRLAVLKAYRRQGVGYALLHAAINKGKHLKLFEVFLDAQIQALDFYQREGFCAYGEEFLDANIVHRPMKLRLFESRLLGLHGGNFAPDNVRATALELISQVNQSLRILSFNLDPSIFDNSEMQELCSSLARKNRHTEIRLLLVDPSALIKQGHKLLNLQRRLSSSIKIKRIGCDPSDIKDNLILADQTGVICQSISEPENIWANYNNKPITTTYIKLFDDLWERGLIDNNLRQLEL